jgi:hypothetical protein
MMPEFLERHPNATECQVAGSAKKRNADDDQLRIAAKSNK